MYYFFEVGLHYVLRFDRRFIGIVVIIYSKVISVLKYKVF